MAKFRVGQIVKSRLNDVVQYKVVKVNKESLDVVSIHSDIRLCGYNHLGQDKELFTIIKGKYNV
jgi:hypothetical protein